MKRKVKRGSARKSKGRGNRRSSSSQKVDALRRSEEINEILETGSMQSPALLSGAGDTKPVDELHSEELLTGRLSSFELSDKTIVQKSQKRKRAKKGKR